ncbi:hypothetical protein EHF33_05510 [Deinococcus psychrotolerans]|uniref:Uncharacterized protein n=1 Tax=Deinococcus psychrotolerans TaxID=2489213 RepID=A0A3G8YID6_9DEIO|nr:hypothetical protein [Deinococcus psychrotolerans]AZI42274.1 hypothetical protein EHF33_05510 [Deinococcus psychrotolerans]
MNKVRWLIPAVFCLSSSVLAESATTGNANFTQGSIPYKVTPCQNRADPNCGRSLRSVGEVCGGCHLDIHTIALRGSNPPLTVWMNQAAWNALPLDGQITLKDDFLYMGNAKFPVEYHNAAGERVNFSGTINITRSPQLPAAKYQFEQR